MAAIEAELAAKGLTAAAANPDVTVTYHIAFDKKQDITAYSTGMGAVTAVTDGAVAGARPTSA